MALTRTQCINWITALRSGEYNQGYCRLYSPESNQYCCLGVLAKINNLPLYSYNLTSEHHSSISLELEPESFTSIGDLVSMGIKPQAHLDSLIYLNDEAGWTFHMIADLLESEYLPNLKD